MVRIDLRFIRVSVDLSGGRRVVLIDPSRDHSNSNRNVFCLDNDGKVLWQVQSDFDDDKSGPFTRLEYKDGKLNAFRWIGLLYEINPETGHAIVVAVKK